VSVAARITDRGKGIDRIEWRMNGITAGIANVPAGAGPIYEVKRELALDALSWTNPKFEGHEVRGNVLYATVCSECL
jgi:hypothetical protein